MGSIKREHRHTYSLKGHEENQINFCSTEHIELLMKIYCKKGICKKKASLARSVDTMNKRVTETDKEGGASAITVHPSASMLPY